MLEVDNVRPMVPGKTLKLTISAPLQAEVEQVLAGVEAEYHPVGATAIVANPRNGQILAIGNYPSVNPNDIGKTPFSATEDQAVGLSYEPGSTFKAITVAGALQDGVVTPDSPFDVPPDLDPYGHVITDAESHGYETLSVADILKVSSNIGADLIAQKMGTDNFASWVSRFGFGRPTGVSLPGEQRGIVLPVSQYSGLSIFNFPFGQGLSVTPMQMVQAYDAIADGGVLRSPQIVSSIAGKPSPFTGPAGKRIIISCPRRLRACATCCAGCSPTAGPRPAPRSRATTSPARLEPPTSRSTATTLDTEYVASFIGMVPASAPKLVVAVVVNEPQNAISSAKARSPRRLSRRSPAGLFVQYFGINPCPVAVPVFGAGSGVGRDSVTAVAFRTRL